MLVKLVDGYPEQPPKEFIENGRRIVGFTDDFLKKRGYKPLIESEPTQPETQMDYYREDENNIYQEWRDMYE